jgi:NAD+ synthase
MSAESRPSATRPTFHRGVLDLDCEAEAERICSILRDAVFTGMHRKGLVVGVSGGIDSAVTAALAARALGKERVLCLLMPERDSSPESELLGRELAGVLGAEVLLEDVAPALEGLGCYRRRDEAVRRVFPGYGPGWSFKIVLSGSPLTDRQINFFRIIAQDPAGEARSERLGHREYLQIVAGSNMKQRARKLLEYYHAERLHYAVAGTPNRLEYDQGFFVKGGDGLADVKPIAHLYKTQVFALAEHLGVPASIRNRPPTTDTYSLAQSQEEFYFAVPYPQMDLLLWARNHDVPPAVAAAGIGLLPDQVERVYEDIERKRATTMVLHLPPVLMEPVAEIDVKGASEAILRHARGQSPALR